MKLASYKGILLVAYITSMSANLLSSPTCMDNSWHLEKRYDDKEYHFVSERPSGPCSCPCEKRYKQLSDRGKCIQCGHFHVPQPLVFVTPTQEQLASPTKEPAYLSKKSIFSL